MKKHVSIAVLAIALCTIMVMTFAASASTLGIITKADIVKIDNKDTITMSVGETLKLVPTQKKTTLDYSGTVIGGLAFDGAADETVIDADRLSTPEYERRYIERVYSVDGAYKVTAKEAGEYTLEIYTPDSSQTRTLYIVVK